MSEEYIKRILDARVYDVSIRSRLHAAPLLSARLNNTVLLKREDEQPIFSFKCRGAYNRIYKLLKREPVKGVIAASAGNHAQGVALSARELGIDAIIVMPAPTPQIKVDAVVALGGKAVLHGDDFNSALEHAVMLSEQNGYAFIHPFDDKDTIAGQGTVGMEICQQHTGDLDMVFLPIGGGGLAAGVSAYIKYLRPEVKIIGVEPVDAACMHDALAADERVVLDHVGLFADGVAVKQAGVETFAVCRETIDEVVLVTVDEMSSAIKDMFNETRTLVEAAGALSIAGMKKYVHQHSLSGKTAVAIVSGANINFDRLRHVVERAEIGDSREALFAVRIPEQPGSFRLFCEAIGKRSVTEFNYRYNENQSAEVFVGVELGGGKTARESLCAQLKDAGYSVLDMSENDTAKLHVRHMIGGHSPAAKESSGTVAAITGAEERLFRFRFPERPGALLGFLSSMGTNWNITLFHYRNHGAAYGRVLVGMQIPSNEEESFNEFLKKLGYPCFDETENPAYKRFLS